jgi:hypothetical protein
MRFFLQMDVFTLLSAHVDITDLIKIRINITTSGARGHNVF